MSLAQRCLAIGTRRFSAAALIGAVVCIPGVAAGGQAPPVETPPIKRVRAHRVPANTITIDGRLNEGAWADAMPAGDFVQQQPAEGRPATHQSDVRFLYDDAYLYIGARLVEDEPNRLVVNELRRDFNARDGDLYIVILDTFNDKLNAYNFQTNPGCALRDSQSYDDGRTINPNWDGVWFCRSWRDDDAWYVEEAIPFKQLRFPRADDQTWGLQIFRLIRHSNEQTVWSPVPRQFNQFKISYKGVLEGIGGVRPGRNIRVKPFLVGQAQGLNGVRRGDGDGGFDVKIGLGTNLVLDGTYRTDFSQVESDAQQLNFTRFNLFFPEKREFFLENQGAFRDRAACDRDKQYRAVLQPDDRAESQRHAGADHWRHTAHRKSGAQQPGAVEHPDGRPGGAGRRGREFRRRQVRARVRDQLLVRRLLPGEGAAGRVESYRRCRSALVSDASCEPRRDVHAIREAWRGGQCVADWRAVQLRPHADTSRT